MHDAFSDEAYWEEEYVFDGKPGREEETRSVHLTRAVLQSAGLIKSKETLALTKKGQAHAASLYLNYTMCYWVQRYLISNGNGLIVSLSLPPCRIGSAYVGVVA